MSLLKEIRERYPEEQIIRADGLDEAIIGFDEQSKRLVYSVFKIVEIFIKRDGMEREAALENYEINVAGSATAETPIYCDDYF